MNLGATVDKIKERLLLPTTKYYSLICISFYCIGRSLAQPLNRTPFIYTGYQSLTVLPMFLHKET